VAWVEVMGSGRVLLPAYGLADAERQVEKELQVLWPEARVRVSEVARASATAAIVEEFAVSYHLRGTVRADSEDAAESRRQALRELRARFEASRFSRVRWEAP
jgi:hypothetical protein